MENIKKINMNKNETVVVVVRGGVVQTVLSTNKEIKAEIIDYDDLGSEHINGDIVDYPVGLEKIY
jgi:hypothetical protein